MEDALLGAPAGFNESCVAVNALVARNAAEALSTFTAAATSAGSATATTGAAARHIISAARKAGVDAKGFKKQLEVHTDLSAEAIEVLLKAYSDTVAVLGESAAGGAGGATGGASSSLSAVSASERIIGFEWALGTSVHASAAAGVTQPFAVIQLRLQDTHSGSVRLVAFELPLNQLAAFEAVIHEAGTALERS